MGSPFMPTLGFYLWLGGAELPVVWSDGTAHESPSESVLPKLIWRGYENEYSSYDDFDEFDYDSDCDYEPPEQDPAGHLKKEAYSLESRRSLRRKAQGTRSDVVYSQPKANRLWCGQTKPTCTRRIVFQ